MKNTLFLMIVVLFSVLAKGQSSPNDAYCTITGFAAAEPFFTHQKQGGLTVSFPYKVSRPTGGTADSIFHSSVIHPFSALKVYILNLGFEIGDRHQFVGIHFAPELMGEGANSKNLSYTLSYGRNLFADWAPQKDWSKKRFVLKPSLSILYSVYKGVNEKSPTWLGAIDDKRRSVDVGGTTIGPTYTYRTTDANFVGHSHTDSTNTLEIYYGQREWALKPKIAIGTNPFAHWYYIEVYAAYTFAFSEKGKVYFSQDDSHTVMVKDLKDPLLTVQYDNMPVKATPYHLNGWNVGFVMGVNLGGLLHRYGL